MTTLYITCPAYAMRGPIDRKKQVEEATWLARELGWQVEVSPLLDRHLGAGAWLPRADRAKDVERALTFDVVWGCRGGFGSIELVDTVLRARRKRGPRLMGYSDITALHGAFARRGWHDRVYGTIASAGLRDGRGAASLLAAWRGEPLRRSHVQDAAARVLRPGRASGRLFPGCLSVLTSLVGTPAMPDLAGCVLAIEDIKLQPFLMATHLNQLHLAGALRGVRALLGGSFTHSEDHEYLGPSPDDVLAEWGARLRVPTISRLPFGHHHDAVALPCNREARVAAGGDGTWTLDIRAAQ